MIFFSCPNKGSKEAASASADVVNTYRVARAAEDEIEF